MSVIKSFSVGNGDMFYIKHGSDNFTIIDCCLSDDNKKRIVNEIKAEKKSKSITRFISTHPDQDHLSGLKYLDEQIDIRNFYCIKNKVNKEVETEDFNHYCGLRDSEIAFHIKKGCTRQWLNQGGDGRGSAGVKILWPDIDNDDFKTELILAEYGDSPNNLSTIINYAMDGGGSFMWMGDLETDFMKKIVHEVEWPKVDILFAAHHGRNSGKVPNDILDQIEPKIIVLGEAPSRHLNYYGNYKTLTQNTAGDITFQCQDGKIHIFVSEPTYTVNFLGDDYTFEPCDDIYLGSLETY